MRESLRSILFRYGCAVASVALLIGLRLLLDPVLGTLFPFETLFLALLVSAWFGGRGPALLALTLGIVAGSFFLLPERGSVLVTSLQDRVGLLLFALSGFGIALLAGAMHAARRSAETSAELTRHQASIIERTDKEAAAALREVNEQLETRVHQRTQALEEALDKVHQAQQLEAFGRLAGGVAHDFNNLLTVISGYCDLLLDSVPADGEARSMVGEIRDAAARASSLTGQLLAISRRQVLKPQLLDLNSVVAGIQGLLKRLIPEDVKITTSLQPNLSVVLVDPVQIQQVIMNLAVNARDAMPRGGHLLIETKDVELDEPYVRTHADARVGRFVMLAISDNGTGMPPEARAHIFEPFFSTKAVGKGTGLGLAVVHGIVKQSGGSIDVYSELGIGTTFKIYLPVAAGDAAGSPAPESSALAGGTETILLAEDEQRVRELASRGLRALGYTVHPAAGGREALQIARDLASPIDLLVTDVVMPDMTGRTLAEELQRVRPGLKLLFVSGYTDDAVLLHGVLQSEVDFLQKPFTPKSLAAKVREVLDRDTRSPTSLAS